MLLLSHDSIFISNKCLTVQLEGFAHELGNAGEWSVKDFQVAILCHLPPDDHFVNHTAPQSCDCRAQLLPESVHSIVIE